MAIKWFFDRSIPQPFVTGYIHGISMLSKGRHGPLTCLWRSSTHVERCSNFLHPITCRDASALQNCNRDVSFFIDAIIFSFLNLVF